MALTATLYKFQIELSDVTRSVYETLEFRVALHPSESLPYMLTRVLAYALNLRDGLSFSTTGLCDPDEAALSIPGELIIEIGNPSGKKLHKATKSAKQVRVYTYKNPDHLMKEVREEKIHRLEAIEFFSVAPAFLGELEALLKRDNRWGLLFNDGVISVQVGDSAVSGDLVQHFP